MKCRAPSRRNIQKAAKGPSILYCQIPKNQLKPRILTTEQTKKSIATQDLFKCFAINQVCVLKRIRFGSFIFCSVHPRGMAYLKVFLKQ